MGQIARLLYRLNRLRWRLTRPLTVGVRLLAVCEGQILLVKHTYQDAWYLPGGGVNKGEALEEAMRREAREEIGATLNHLRLFGVYSNFFEHKSDHVIVFTCTDFELTGSTDHEIERFAFFDPHCLPDGTSPGTGRRIAEYLRNQEAVVARW